MSGYIPDPPDKSILDYLDKAKHNGLRIPIALLKIVIGVLTFILVPLSLAVYIVLMLFARRFMFSAIPDLCSHVINYSIRLIRSGFFDLFYRINMWKD